LIEPAGFSWTISANGVLISGSVIGAITVATRVIVRVLMPAMRTWSEIQDSLLQTKQNTIVIEQLKLSNDKLTTIVESLEPRIEMMENLTKQYFGKRISQRGAD
jgi:hypothetical protein